MAKLVRGSLDLPPGVAQRFVADMRQYFAETDLMQKDEIAARQMHVLNQYRGPREPALGIIRVKEMFKEMRDHLADPPPMPKRAKRVTRRRDD